MNENVLKNALLTADTYISGVELALDLINSYIASQCTVTDKDDSGTTIAKCIKTAVLEDFENWIDSEIVNKLNDGFAELLGINNEEYIFLDVNDEE